MPLRLSSIALRIFCLAAAMLCLNLDSGCRDPDEFQPPEDTLVTPPDAPHLIAPTNDFVFMVNTRPYYIKLEWDSIEGAEVYERELAYDTFPPTTAPLSTNYDVIAIVDSPGDYGKYHWRVRASSSGWQGGYTAWSEQWNLEVRFMPSPPPLRYPLDSAIFYCATLPQTIDFGWSHVADEQFYEFELSQDSFVIEQTVVYDTIYPVVFYEAGEYSWRVRAGSSHWQYYTPWSLPWNFQIVLNYAEVK